MEDVDAAVRAGADALGFVFVPASPRFVEPTVAADLCRSVPAFVSRVGLFLDQGAEYVGEVLRRVPLSMLQFHGSESPEFCRQFGLPYIKAVSSGLENPVAAAENIYTDAAGILIDSHHTGGLGGTGRQVDPERISAGRLPLILAGGLNPENVRNAIRTVRPWAVDVSSGVETSPGIKNPEAVRRFIEEAKCEQTNWKA